MHKHKHKHAGEERKFKQALTGSFCCENGEKKKKPKTISPMRPVQNVNTNPLCEYARWTISHGEHHSSAHLNMQMFPSTKSLDKLLLHDSCGCRHNSLKIYYRRQKRREESGPRRLPGRCCMHACIRGCLYVCLCVSTEECDNADGVSLLLTRIRDVLGHTGYKGAGRRGHQNIQGNKA